MVADDHQKEGRNPEKRERDPEYLGYLARSGRGWGLEPLTCLGRGPIRLEGERQREGAIWRLEVEDSSVWCLGSGEGAG